MVEKRHLQHLKNIMSGAAPLGSLDEEKFLEKADYKVNMIQGELNISCQFCTN